MNYKKGDLVRGKHGGTMWYYVEMINGKACCNLNKHFTGLSELFNLDEIEPLPLRHPYYGKMVLVNGIEERIFIDDRTDGVVAVKTFDEEAFRNGEVYNTSIWDSWAPIPEEAPADPTTPTAEELAAFKIVQKYLDRLNEELNK